MAGYFQLLFDRTYPTSKTLRIKSVDGYKGSVIINFTVTGPGGPTVNNPLPYAFLDEDEEMSATPTVSGGTAGQSGTLTATGHDDVNTDTDEIGVTFSS